MCPDLCLCARLYKQPEDRPVWGRLSCTVCFQPMAEAADTREVTAVCAAGHMSQAGRSKTMASKAGTPANAAHISTSQLCTQLYVDTAAARYQADLQKAIFSNRAELDPGSWPTLLMKV